MMERVYGERVLSESTLNGVVVSQVVQRGAEPKEEIVRCSAGGCGSVQCECQRSKGSGRQGVRRF